MSTAPSAVPTFTCRWRRDTFWIASATDEAANRAYWAERDHHEQAACIGHPGHLPQLVDVGAARAAVVAIATAPPRRPRRGGGRRVVADMTHPNAAHPTPTPPVRSTP